MDRDRVVQFATGLEVNSPYYFGEEIADLFPGVLARHTRDARHAADRCFVVASGRPLRLFGDELLGAIEAAGVPCATVVIDDAERRKDWGTLRGVCEDLVSGGATKDSVVLALGGGVLGNVAGLAAALVYRGIRFVQVPTTVTAQTDSTLSNKQAVNGSRGKNQFGVYHAPLFVWGDAAYPRTEPPRQQKSGIVEGVKNVLISQDRTDAADAMLDLWDAGRLPELLRRLIDSKLDILRRDPTERGYALVLEYGHTFGHAIEWLAGGDLLHGEAVSIGMCLAAELSHAMGLMPDRLLREHYRLLGERLGTPTHLPADIDPAAVYEAMLADNKRTAKGLRFLLLREWGRFAGPDDDLMVPAEKELVLRVLEQSRMGSPPPQPGGGGARKG